MTTADDVKARAAQKAQPPATTGGNPPAQQQPPTIAKFIGSMTGELAKALPRGMDADRMARVILTCVRKTPALANCSQDSFAGAMLSAAALGLEPGVNGECYLVPHGRECTLIVGYQGFVKLFWQHPLASNIDCHAVYESDEFDFAYGLHPRLEHKPSRDPGRERGKVLYYYAVATLQTGASAFCVLTPEQVLALRKKEGPNGGIADPMLWMERKTAVRQLVKMLPKSASLVKALAVDEQEGSRLYAERLAEQQIAAQVEQAKQIEGQVVETNGGGTVDTSTGVVITPDESEAPPAPGETPTAAPEGGEAPDFDQVREQVAEQDGWPPVAQPGDGVEVAEPPYREDEQQ